MAEMAEKHRMLNYSMWNSGDIQEAIVDEFISELAAFALDQENHRPHLEEKQSILAREMIFPSENTSSATKQC